MLLQANLIKTLVDIFRLRNADLKVPNETDATSSPGTGTSDLRVPNEGIASPVLSLRTLKGWGDRSVNNLLAAIDAKREVDCHR